MRYLVTNADDLGWGSDITRGIIDSFGKGVLTSASVLVSEIDKESVSLIKKTDGLGLGLHLNIATGKPVSDIWKNNYGDFSHPTRETPKSPYIQKMWDDTYGEFDVEIIFKEFQSQLLLFKKIFDRYPDHLDTHYNTFSVDNVFEAYLTLAQKYTLPLRQPVGYISQGNMEDGQSTSELVHKKDFLKKLKLKNIKTTDYFSLEYINLHKDYIGAILNEVKKVKENQSLEISFHPGYREEWRVRQVEILTNPELKKELEKANVKLVTFYELKDIK